MVKKNEIRRKTCLIIRKNGRYLKGRSMLTNEVEWTWSAYEAWRTRDRALAEEVAKATGGILMLFNPIVNRKLVLGA